MIIRKIQHHQQFRVSSDDALNNKHTEKRIVTTWYFLFIPIIRLHKIITSNL